MSMQRLVDDFLSKGQLLYQKLRADGEALSDVELVSLREQLHLLDAEAGRLQELKEFDSEVHSFMFASKRQPAAKQLSRRQG